MLTLRQKEGNSGTPEAIQIQYNHLVGFNSRMQAIYASLSNALQLPLYLCNDPLIFACLFHR